jgi:O-methyltransferase
LTYAKGVHGRDEWTSGGRSDRKWVRAFMVIRSVAQRVRGRLRRDGQAPAETTSDEQPLGAPPQPHLASVLDEQEKQTVADVRFYTMVSTERLIAVMDAVKYVVQRGIPGAMVECGVWRGGSVLAMIKTLQQLGVTDRDVYLYDTFEGMTAPGEHDTSPFEQPAARTWEETPEGVTPWAWAFDKGIYDVELVRGLIYDSGYPRERIHFVKGPVEETIPGTLPDAIAVLRLDTDWYESTKHELEHLYPLMPDAAVLIVDDYGHWEGARRAVEEYFSGDRKPLFFARSDYSGRIAVKHD